MHVEIRPYCDGWAYYLIDPESGSEAVASSRPFVSHHEAVEQAQKLMLNGLAAVVDQHPDRPRGGSERRS